MRPTTKGLLLLAGLTVPTALSAVFLFGCCVLPFHRYLHTAMPLCHMASEIVGGHHDGDGHDGDHQATPPPSREKRTVGFPSIELFAQAQLFLDTSGIHLRQDSARTGLRSFMSLGAVRCENDVGLHLLLTTFRI